MNPTAYTGNDPFAVVSYARSDEARVLPLLEQLADLSIRVWYDQGGLSGSELWMGELAKRITACHVFVLCVTSGAVRCEWVVRELGFAVTQKRRILPIVIEPVEFPPEIGFLLHSVHHIQAHALAPDDL